MMFYKDLLKLLFEFPLFTYSEHPLCYFIE